MTNSESDTETVPAATERKPAKFDTKKVYLKDVSFEAPSTPAVFTLDISPKFDVQIGISHTSLDDDSGLFEIILKVLVTTKHENKVLYLVEIQQAGVFQIQHPDPDKLILVIEVTCPHILLPFAREEINNLITKGGFNAFLLAPVNFESIFRSKKEKEIEQAASADITGKPN